MRATRVVVDGWIGAHRYGLASGGKSVVWVWLSLSLSLSPSLSRRRSPGPHELGDVRYFYDFFTLLVVLVRGAQHSR